MVHVPSRCRCKVEVYFDGCAGRALPLTSESDPGRLRSAQTLLQIHLSCSSNLRPMSGDGYPLEGHCIDVRCMLRGSSTLGRPHDSARAASVRYVSRFVGVAPTYAHTSSSTVHSSSMALSGRRRRGIAFPPLRSAFAAESRWVLYVATRHRILYEWARSVE